MPKPSTQASLTASPLSDRKGPLVVIFISSSGISNAQFSSPMRLMH